MTWDFIIEVPFASKAKFFRKSNLKYSFSGNAYFLINNKGQVLRDFAQITGDNVQIRPNDNAMKIGKTGEGTHYWKNEIVFNARKLFPNSPLNFQVKDMGADFIKKINNFAINHHNTILSMESLISGSNPTGADAKIDAAPLWAMDKELFSTRFINPLKFFRCNKNNRKASINYPITSKIIEEANKLSLKEYLEKFPEVRRKFIEYNPEIRTMFEQDKNEETQKIYYFDASIKLKKESNSYIALANVIIQRYENSDIKKINLINRLRGIFRNLLEIEAKIIDEPIFIGIKEKIKNLDAAHLYDVRWIKKENDDNLWKIADVYNGILLPKDIHWKFDKDPDFYISDNFEFFYKNKKLDLKINPKYINNKRINYIKKRNNKLYSKIII